MIRGVASISKHHAEVFGACPLRRRGVAERGGPARMWSSTGSSSAARAMTSSPRQGREQELAQDLDVSGQRLGQPRAAGVGDRHRDAAVVVGRRAALDQPAFSIWPAW